jgi:hypothetical protein
MTSVRALFMPSRRQRREQQPLFSQHFDSRVDQQDRRCRHRSENQFSTKSEMPPRCSHGRAAGLDAVL